VLLLSLHKLGHPIKFHCLGYFYNKDWTVVNRAFNWFMKYLRTQWGHLITNSWAFWRPHLEEFTEKIRLKIEAKSDGNIVYPPGGMSLFGFLDDTSQSTCRVGGGPAERGEDAIRFNSLLQMAFYSGYKKNHGVKFQSVELPNGMAIDFYGPLSIRHSDTELVTYSNLEEKLRVLSDGSAKLYSVYGDGIFQCSEYIKSKHVEGSREKMYENGIMFKVRIPNEWAYGITENLFSSLKWKPGLKLRKCAEHAFYYVGATILRNAHACLEGNQIGIYFHCKAPELEDYFNMSR
jgi:hypothetical protein